MAQSSWKRRLKGQIEGALEREIDAFETDMDLRKKGKIDERLFAEARLRRGVYGQRYDNGERHDGTRTRTLAFPNPELTKGPDTRWDAPGMMRIKIPYGKLTADQLDVLAELAEEYSDRIVHITTRQDVQYHFIHIEDAPDLMRRLAAVGITTREACGNSVRNVTACQFSGVCKGETFDVTPYAHALTQFLLGHPDTQDFGRKVKIAFSGCRTEPCGLVTFHDLGAIATTRMVDGVPTRGFEVYVGGGLGAVPFEAKVLAEFVTEAELLPLAQATCRVFARLGEKKNRARARVKFLVKKLGIEAFRTMVEEERQMLEPDPRWTDFLDDLHAHDETPLREGGPLSDPETWPEGFEAFQADNLRPQRQAGYYVATIVLPLGDLTSEQTRALADLARKYTGDAIRTTVEQNIVLRWVSGADAVALYEDLRAVGLGESGASTISDITSCPGTDTCKLGISASRGLAGELRKRLTVLRDDLPSEVRSLRIKASGCFNSCGQHHVADLGFLGVSRNVGGRRVPHFQVVLGGQWKNNGGSYGLPIGAVPAKNVPEAVKRITQRYAEDGQEGETFQAFIQRIGKAEVRKILDGILKVPAYADDPSYYSDWGDPREYTIDDLGVGECAGEVVPFVEFGLSAAERESFEAQIRLDEGKHGEAARGAYRAMLTAAQALARHVGAQVADEDEAIVTAFRREIYDAGRFHDKYAGGKFAAYFFKTHEGRDALDTASRDDAHAAIDEAQLFIEAAYACYERITQTAAEPVAAE